MAGDLANSFKDAVALAATQDKNRATRIYADIDLRDYYKQKYFPVFQSCLKSTEHPGPINILFRCGDWNRRTRVAVLYGSRN